MIVNATYEYFAPSTHASRFDDARHAPTLLVSIEASLIALMEACFTPRSFRRGPVSAVLAAALF